MTPGLEQLLAHHLPATRVGVSPLPVDGSSRRRWRLTLPSGTLVATAGDDIAENRAFVALARHFGELGLPVPRIHAFAEAGDCYLEDDLGDTTLFGLLQRERALHPGERITPAVRAAYLSAVAYLPRFQVIGAAGLDWRFCHPRPAFDRQSMYWDLNYFKYYFLRLARISFHEQALEDDFSRLVAWLEQVPANGFLYRDFQSRNIMLTSGGPAFIDFQGGRRGALAYDVASLVLDAKADLPADFRAEIVEAYLESLTKLQPVDVESFRSELQGFSLIRMLQAMGAYGFRGFYERKEHFLQSVPYAIANLGRLLDAWSVPLQLPALFQALRALGESPRLRSTPRGTTPLHVPVTSFSYKKGLPQDTSGHGGGHVFDCRLLPNPGRDPVLAAFTGKDPEISVYLDRHEEVAQFLENCRSLIRASVLAYQARGFDHLSIAFGCTGGRHRSVHCAERTVAWLRTLPGVRTEVIHSNLPSPSP